MKKMHIYGKYTLIALSFAACQVFAKPYATLDGDTLKIGNDEIERTFEYNGGDLRTLSVLDKKSGISTRSTAKSPDLAIPSQNGDARDGYFKTRDVADSDVEAGWLECEIGFRKGNLEVKRVFRIYEKSPAIACQIYFRGKPDARDWVGSRASSADMQNIETITARGFGQSALALDTLSFAGRQWNLLAAEFFDVTDHHNNLVREVSALSYRKMPLRGNILFMENKETGAGFFWLKESPVSLVQLAYPAADFFTEWGKFLLVGAGVDASDISADKWTPAYGYVFGVWNGGERERLLALRSYQKNLRRLKEGRDEMVMLNTWGDRGQDTKVNEAFCKEEIARAKKMGITHFQIDDGWQIGKSGNSAYGGSFLNIWANPDYWKPSPEKYPNGLQTVVDAARNAGIELCLWFNPSWPDDFADWQKDVAALTSLYDKFGIRTFKIDGMKIRTKLAEERVRAMFDAVLAHTKGRAVLNLDVTAGRRGGYFSYSKYGNIFLENRYTDWQNYYPYWTLRNIWTISKYVPAERLQIEFLNNDRNIEKYGNDPFAPAKYDIRYLFATTMAAQPLAWMEATGLSDENIEKLAPLVRDYKKVSHDFHTGTIMPIGEEPSGRSWTGFQSVKSPTSGYVIAYREFNPAASKKMATRFDAGAEVSFEPVLGSAKAFRAEVDADSRVEFSLPEENSFGMWKYTVLKKPSKK